MRKPNLSTSGSFVCVDINNILSLKTGWDFLRAERFPVNSWKTKTNSLGKYLKTVMRIKPQPEIPEQRVSEV